MSRVELWHVDVAAAAARRERQLTALLDEAERERAARFVRPADALRYRVAHGALRVILGRRLDAAPAELAFAPGRYGKPALVTGGPAFSLAHSAGVAIVAVSARLEVGADVERLRPVPGGAALARRFLAPGSWEAPAATGFMRSWTAIEAVAKAAGTGLGPAHERLELRALSADRARAWPAGRRSAARTGWSIRWLTPAPRYVAAIAAAGCGALELRVRRFA